MNLTENAEKQVIKLLEEHGDAVALRIGIVGGGCSGFNYVFHFAEEIEQGDTVINDSGAIVVCDPMSWSYLAGATVDYVKNLEGDRFTIDNPNAQTTCGCGTSFSV